jgi:hypothetical protein
VHHPYVVTLIQLKAAMDGPSLAESLFGKKADEVWQDREVRFDVAGAQLQCRRGEEVLDTFVSTGCANSSTHTASAHAPLPQQQQRHATLDLVFKHIVLWHLLQLLLNHSVLQATASSNRRQSSSK